MIFRATSNGPIDFTELLRQQQEEMKNRSWAEMVEDELNPNSSSSAKRTPKLSPIKASPRKREKPRYTALFRKKKKFC